MNNDSCLLKFFKKPNLNVLIKKTRTDYTKQSLPEFLIKKCPFYIISIGTMINNKHS